MDDLPFTTEGYERAKNTVKTRYGKESEIVNAYVTGIMALAVIHWTNPNKILDFLRKAVFERSIPGNCAS